MTPSLDSSIITNLTEGTGTHALEVLGPHVEFLTLTDDGANQICVMRAVIPPGVTVPLHSHDDFEDFYIVSGGHEVLVAGPDGLQWREARPGDYIQVPGEVPHAHRNTSDKPAVDLVITTPRMGRFFQEVGRPADAPPRTPDEVAHFVETAHRYGYRLGTPEENAAVGIALPSFNG
ncbi:cupin domain-containing protein [Mycolicibacterium boenickei]|uniref:Cupin n=1 Tax=Mycolicibacterium boenickei TaxID=146017 RepID=A0AAX2ZTL7_9MYCO|nr:cupin domain-containing protein [Mycolicibacterium boenickei]PEG60514.1 cupin domain-containing protein [Mycolicibacterium boenickei]UNB98030.1 cupin domain-containing protein [Mycolicibacterium boenickei]BBX93785.1 cupin [Mycolicibacterium boenickei]